MHILFWWTWALGSPRSTKGLLPFRSGHTKIVRRSIAVSCGTGAISRSFRHLMADSLDLQVTRLEQAGHTLSWLFLWWSTVVLACLWVLWQIALPLIRDKRFTVIPYMHRISHNPKNVARRRDIRTVMSVPVESCGLCRRTGDLPNPNLCLKKHLLSSTAQRTWFTASPFLIEKHRSVRRGALWMIALESIPFLLPSPCLAPWLFIASTAPAPLCWVQL